MLKSLTSALVATMAFGGLALPATDAGAMPMIDRSPAVAVDAAAGAAVEDVRWVCGPYRCFHRRAFYPSYGYGYGYGYGWRHPHRWHRPYGYGFHGGWRRWHRW